jgi:hypothetical protein
LIFMKLIGLLTAGRSLIGINSDPCRYKMLHENILPRFIPAPRRSAPAMAAPMAETVALAEKCHTEVGLESPLSSVEPSFDFWCRLTLRAFVKLAQASSAIASGIGSGLNLDGKSKQNAFRLVRAADSSVSRKMVGATRAKYINLQTEAIAERPSRNAPVVPGKRSFFRKLFGFRASTDSNRIFVQGELALESLKVVRNDLIVTDMELIPVRASVKKSAPTKQKPGVNDSASSENGWMRLITHFFEASRSKA